jgi:hypothetical protein
MLREEQGAQEEESFAYLGPWMYALARGGEDSEEMRLSSSLKRCWKRRSKSYAAYLGPLGHAMGDPLLYALEKRVAPWIDLLMDSQMFTGYSSPRRMRGAWARAQAGEGPPEGGRRRGKEAWAQQGQGKMLLFETEVLSKEVAQRQGTACLGQTSGEE